MLGIFLFGSLVFVAGTHQAIQVPGNMSCIFTKIANCYHNISTLGANFSVKYEETKDGVLRKCQNLSHVAECLAEKNECRVNLTANNITAFRNHLHGVCNQDGQYGKDYLNFTKCCNRIINERTNCIKIHKAKNRTDNKDLCCESFRSQRCITDAAFKKCSDYDAATSSNMYNMYRIFHTTLCEPFRDICSGSSQNCVLYSLILMAAFMIRVFPKE